MKTTPRSILPRLRLRPACAVKLLPLVLLLMLSPAAVQAQFSYTTNNGTITITGGCPGSAGAVIIPDTINGLPVTSIGDSAFSHCTSLANVTIPDSVTSIGDSAFSDCTSLTSVTIPNSVTSIEGWAFNGCTGLTSVTIPDSVTRIGGTFQNCSSLTSVTIPNSVTWIGDSTFQGCTSLTSITIPDSVTSIGAMPFADCTSLTELTIPNSLLNPGLGLLTGLGQPVAASGLRAIKVNESIMITGYNCSTTVVTIPDTINGLPVTSIEREAFSFCTNLTSIKISDSVTSIGVGAFASCDSLTSITIPDNVTRIGSAAFAGCTSLTSVTIPNSVTSIEHAVFWNCTSLTSVTIGNSVTSIGRQPFAGCSSLTAITVDALNSIYSSVDGVLFNKSQTTIIQYPEGKAGSQYTIPDGVTRIGELAFYMCTNLTSVTIPNSVLAIQDSDGWLEGAFASCTSLTNVMIGNRVMTIGSWAFYNTKLTSVTIPNSVTSIGDNAFSFCNGLTSVTIPNGVTSIGHGAFWACGGLVYVTMSSNVTSIEPNAFQSCPRLTAVTVDALNSIYGSVDGVFFDKSKSTLIQYPAGKDGTSYTISDRVTSIGDSAFHDCESLTNVIIPPSVTTIGRAAFEASGLTSVTIPTSVTSIGDYAFSWCSRLKAITVDTLSSSYGSIDGVLFDKSYTSILQCPGGRTGDYTIPNSVTSIGDMAFTDSSLSNVIIGDSVTSIGDTEFFNCTNLTSITIPNSVTSIGREAFYRCKNLTSITIPNSVTSIGESAFSLCSGLTSVTIGNSVTSIGGGAFYDCTNLTGAYFQGNSPSDDQYPFGDSNTTVFYLPGTTGWSATFSERPTALWVLPNPVILTTVASNLGVQDNSFGFTISWATNTPVVVEAATDPTNPTWSPVSTNTLTDGSSYFSDPQWTNSPARFYRLRSP